ncbi:M48 family metallopeptidase [Tautonia sociabilis]|uniref:Zn-dependent protease with chaperone function n=1 Tax=Tautonia sociabilis TaxID=2080755 RepID=A0A432MQA5_9BACT|nr:M48 family metallopeptidase [Tautonia sociabilis]RUL89188.1 Zn-dependent protease with chaperone function [Tautonia sociabilis]
MGGADVGRDPNREPGPTIGGLSLRLRGLGLAVIAGGFPVGNALGAGALIALGGFVPVVGGWLDDRVTSWSDVVATLGGVCPSRVAGDPDADHGPVLGRADAPELFDEVAALARRAGARPPGQLRLSYLPCCGATAWGRRGRALLIGLPLLSVLTRIELRAVLAHELAHLARGDATSVARSARFVEALGRSLDASRTDRARLSPLLGWARLCHAAGSALLAPIARGQETRADRFAASVAGGDATASALVKVALVQPLFREVLGHYRPDVSGGLTLYGYFRSFWRRLPEPLLTSMRHGLLSELPARSDGAHPPLIDRLAVVQSYSNRPPTELDLEPAESVLGDPIALERMLHNRLFGPDTVPAGPSLFHRAGS